MGRPKEIAHYDEKICSRCGRQFRREDLPRRVSHAAWATRRYCSRACTHADLPEMARQLRRPSWRDGTQASKTCARCGTVFHLSDVPYKIAFRQWAERRYCSIACQRPLRGRERDETGLPEAKECERCGATFGRPRRHGYQITHAAWAARRYCSEQCRREAMADRVRGGGENHPAWKGDQAKRGHSRARKLYPELGACERCGHPAELRHHRDEDTLNNDPSNIEFLCRPCHVSHHDPRGARRN